MTLKEKILYPLYAVASLVGKAELLVLDEPYGSLFQEYGNEIFYPMVVSFGLRAYDAIKNIPQASTRFMAEALAFGFGFAEGLDAIGLIPGTTSIGDFLAYATGIGLASGINKLTFRNQNIETAVSEPINE